MPITDWAPELSDVGAVLRARTKDDVGNEIGTFNAETRPTDDQVNALINQAASAVAMVVGSDVSSVFWSDASSVTAYRAAMLVELSYYPEQINSSRSPYPQLKQLYDDSLKALLMAIESSGGTTPGGGGAPGGPMRPSYSSPCLPVYPDAETVYRSSLQSIEFLERSAGVWPL